MLPLVKNWFANFLEKEEHRKQRIRATQSQMERACVSHPHVCFVVSNDSRTKSTVSDMARSIGAAAFEARSSQDCLEAFSKCVPGIMLLDVVLHKSDAIDVIRGLALRNYAGPVQIFCAESQLAADVYAIGKRYQLNMLPILATDCPDEVLWNVLREHLVVSRPNKPPDTKPTRNVDLASALEFGWIEPWYQPKIDLNKRALVGVEALARLNHPEHGVIPPSSFLRNASLESMHELTEHMVAASMRDWSQIRQTGFVAHMAVNVGVDCLLNIPFAQLIRETRPSDEDWPGLVLEITEDQAIKDVPLFHEIATQLRIYDVSFSIDDFGAGYSSLARLKQVPFSELKLDGGFVRRCSSDEKNAGICKAVIDLAHTYGAIATAECVDESDDLIALHRMGCDVAQGYLLCKPMPIDKLVSVLMQKSGIQQNKVGRTAPGMMPTEQEQLSLQYAK